MITCRVCHKEWNGEENGLVCPFCHTENTLSRAEIVELFHKGVSCEQDQKYPEALKRYRLAAECGYTQAKEAYARCLEDGIGTRQDHDKAIRFYREAAVAGSSRAAYRLSRLLTLSPKKGESSLFWLAVATVMGDNDAALTLWALPEEEEALAEWQIDDEARFAYLYRAAMAGDGRALLTLASAYRLGRRTPINLSAALWYYGAVSRTSLFSRLRFLFFRLRYRGIEPKKPVPPIIDYEDEKQRLLGESAMADGHFDIAFPLFLAAAEAKNPDAALRVAGCCLDGIGAPRDFEAAVRFYELAEQGGNIAASHALGAIYREKGDKKRAEEHYLLAASSGVPEYAYTMGRFYLELGTEEAMLEGLEWLEKAKGGRYAPAAEFLLELEAKGQEYYRMAVSAAEAGDVSEALSLYRTAVSYGNKDALSNLGYCMQKGIGCRPDMKGAATAYRLAATGSDAGRLNYALCLLRGTGVRRNFKEAEALLSRVGGSYKADAEALLASVAAGRERKRARRLYSRAAALYRTGDVPGALRLRIEAAKMGDPAAAYLIGCHFEFGDGVAPDRERAMHFYQSAVEAGLTSGQSRLKSGFLREKRRLGS